jgi:hypothetical protein
MRSSQGGGIQAGGWALPVLRTAVAWGVAGLEDLRGVDDDRDDAHRLVTARAAQRFRVADLPDQPGPCGPLRGPWADTESLGCGSWGGPTIAFPAPRRPAPRERGGAGGAGGTTLP